MPGLGVVFSQGNMVLIVFAVRPGTLRRKRDRGLLALVLVSILNNPAVFVSWLSHMNM